MWSPRWFNCCVAALFPVCAVRRPTLPQLWPRGPRQEPDAQATVHADPTAGILQRCVGRVCRRRWGAEGFNLGLGFFVCFLVHYGISLLRLILIVKSRFLREIELLKLVQLNKSN